MDVTYRLLIVGQSGMYTSGDAAASPALARIAVGALIRGGDRGVTDRRVPTLGIERTEWTFDADGHLKAVRTVLIEVEDYPGQWTIGVPGESRYSPGRPQAQAVAAPDREAATV